MKLHAIIAAGMLATPVGAEDTLPSQMKWTAFGTNSSGYAQAIAIGNMLKQEGTRVAVLPGQNDIARLTPLKNGQADYCMCGGAAFFSIEGVFDFAAAGWGPQPLRMVLSRIDDTGTTFFTRGNSGVETPADLKGKRVPFLRAGASTNVAIDALLAFADLTRDDVETVTYGGYGESMEGLVNGEIDVHFATSVTPKSAQLAASPDGVHWLSLDHDNTEAWDRMNSVAPYLAKRVVKVASGLAEGESFEASAYPYPLLVTPEDTSEGEIYSLTKAMIENHQDYIDAAPGAMGWALERQDLWIAIPYHEGAVRYFREAGVWTDELEAHNDALIKRQNVLIDAFKAFEADAPGDKDAFKTAWMEARAEALTEAGLPVFFD